MESDAAHARLSTPSDAMSLAELDVVIEINVSTLGCRLSLAALALRLAFWLLILLGSLGVLVVELWPKLPT